MAATEPIVIIGASLAGVKAAEALREAGYAGAITLIGDESEPPYERPPLSKQYLMGTQERGKMFVHDPEWYREQRVDLLLGSAVEAIDRERGAVVLAGGRRLAYGELLLTTGARPRRLSVPGADVEGVYYLRHVADCEQLRHLFQTASRVVLVGGGWIGLEVAAAAREAGVEATVVEMDALPLGRVLGPEIARVFADLHREHGVDLRTGVQVAEILGEGGRASGVLLADGTRIEADAVIVGVGAVPNVELAEAAGLVVDNGVVVDASLRTSDPHIFAAGDVANAFHPLLGKHIRVEHWDNARRQSKAAAQAMLGEDVAYDHVPYFFTDQYDLGMEYSGHIEPGGYDEVVVRGDLSARKFVAFWLDRGRVKAGMNVNIWNVNKQIQRLVRSGDVVDKGRLADPDVPLDTLSAS
ncbi:NAD(P)/FAD-dependent oxidoreductase [Actinospica robiniae]|uniref:NAD(P)/FAD-dependent oxidoreductase n=1 Tax=Actinospica robiniae TaxID=304901 RepID=UPI0003F6A322|nr:FAD-dependent oxidoreductase [Actinospica robiniae]